MTHNIIILPSCITKQLSPDEKREKITIKDIPLSIASQEIEQYLKDKNVGLVTDVKFAHERDPNGQLTSFKNGDRYIYAKGMIDPILTRNVFICGRKCRIFHEGQFVKECRACGRRNHGTGDVSCPAKNNEDNITAFSSYKIPLSNMYPVELKIEDETFKSVQEAWLWMQATQCGDDTLAQNIRQSRHGGEAARLLADNIDKEKSRDWEHNNTDIMSELLRLKSEQCPEFRQALLEDNRVLAAAIRDPFWGTCLSVKDTVNSKPDFWPGKNMIGALQMELRNTLKSESRNEPGTAVIKNKDTDTSIQQTSDGSETPTKDTKENPQSLTKDEKETGDRDRNSRPGRGSTRGLGSRVRSESLNFRARSKEQSNKSQNAETVTPRREQMNIREFMRKRKPTGTPPKEDGKQPKQPNMRDNQDSTHDGSGSTSTPNDGQNAASNSAVS